MSSVTSSSPESLSRTPRTALHLRETPDRPALVIDIDLRRRGCHPRDQPRIAIEFVDADVVELTPRRCALDLDGVGALALRRGVAVFQPGAAASVRAAPGFGLDELGSLIGYRGDVVAHHEGQHGEGDTQAHQQAECRHRSQAAGAQDGELRRLRQPRHGIDGPDEHRDRHQLVQVTRQQQQAVEQGVLHLVAAAAHPLELIHDVDEEEQRQEGHGDEADGTEHIGIEQATDGLHAAFSLA